MIGVGVPDVAGVGELIVAVLALGRPGGGEQPVHQGRLARAGMPHQNDVAYIARGC